MRQLCEQRQERRKDEDNAEQADRLDQAHDDRIGPELVGDARDLRNGLAAIGAHHARALFPPQTQ